MSNKTNKKKPQVTHNLKTEVKEIKQEINQMKKKNQNTKKKQKDFNRYNAVKGTGGVKDQKSSYSEFEFEETVFAVPSSAPYGGDKFRLNPGNSIFPYLSKQAVNFEKYRVEYCEFRYIPSINQLSANSNGTIIMGYEPNPLEEVPNTLVAAQNMDYKCYGIPAKPQVLRLNKNVTNSDMGWKYVNPNKNYPPGSDPKLYDFGYLWVGTQGQIDNTSIIGTIVMKYKIYFKVNKVYNTLAYLPNYSVSRIDYAGVDINASETPQALTDPQISQQVTGIAIEVTPLGPKLVQGNYLVFWNVQFGAFGSTDTFNAVKAYVTCTRNPTYWYPKGDQVLDLAVSNINSCTLNGVEYLKAQEGDILYFYVINPTLATQCNASMIILSI